MPIELTSNIVPKNNGSFPTHDALYGRGGKREVDTLSDRDGIPASRRTSGMHVYVRADQKTYVLQNNLTAWVEDPLATRLGLAETSLTSLQASINSVVLGPNSSVDSRLAVFDGTTGNLLKDSGLSVSTVISKQDKSTRVIANGAVTAALGNLIAADTTSGTFVITLPLTSAGKGEVKIKWIAGTVPPSIVLQSPDVIDAVGGATTFTPSRLGQVYTLEGDAGIWTQTTDDYASYLKTTQGALQVGHARTTLSGPPITVGDFINAGAVSVWEYAHLITVKPTPADWSTWDWQPAIQGALNNSKRVFLPQQSATVAYRTSPLTISRGDAELIVPASQNVLCIGVADDAAGVTLTGDSAKIFGGIWRTDNVLSNIIRTNGFRQLLFDVKAGTGNEGGCKNALVVDGTESAVIFGRYRSGSNAGILVGNTDLYLQNIYVEQNRVGLRSESVGFITAHHVHSFSNSVAGFYLAGANYSQLSACYADTNGQNGYEIRDVTSGLTMTDCWGYKSSNLAAGYYDFAFYNAKDVRLLGCNSSGAGAQTKGGSIRLQADSIVQFIGTRAELPFTSNDAVVALQKSTFIVCSGSLRKYNKPDNRINDGGRTISAAGGTAAVSVSVPIILSEITSPGNLLFGVKILGRTTTGAGVSLSGTFNVMVGIGGVSASVLSMHTSDFVITSPALTANADSTSQLAFTITNNNALPVQITSFIDYFGTSRGTS